MSFSTHLLWSALNSVWQSAAIAIIVFVATRMYRTSAAQRYLVWYAVLLAIVALPFVNVALPARTVNLPPTSSTTSTQMAAAPPSVAIARAVLPVTRTVVQRGTDGAGILYGLWGAIALALTLRLMLGYARLRRLRMELKPHHFDPAIVAVLRTMTPRAFEIGLSPTLTQPCVIGFVRPVICIPEALIGSLSDEDVVRILRHECAHITRYDDLGNVFEQLARALCFFNPVVYAVTAALDIDREIACDDAVASAERERIEFAKCLYEIARRRHTHQWLPATGFARNPGALIHRVAQLLDRNHIGSASAGRFARVIACGVVLAAIPFGYMQISACALTPKGAISTLHLWRPSHTPPAVPHEHPTTQHVVAAPSAPLLAAATPAVVARATPVSRGDDFLDELVTDGYHGLSTDDLIRLHDSGVDSAYLRQLRALGYQGIAVDQLIRMHDNGVGPAYIRELSSAGVAHASPEQLIRLRDDGVSGAYIAHLRQSGLVRDPRSLSIEELIRLHDRGV